jgi:apolipoprotein N-acyltransferase
MTDHSQDKSVPLCVDLDGTLIKSDMMGESLIVIIQKNPLMLLPIFYWWLRGRAFLKKKLGERVQVDAAALSYNERFLEFLREAKRLGRPLILATASDRKMVEPVVQHIGLFDEVFASDGKTNLRNRAKLEALTRRFGERAFDYAGNSTMDLPVWEGSREAIVVNASQKLADQAAERTKLGPLFLEGYSSCFLAKRILHGLLIESRWLYAIFAGLLLTAAFPKIGIAGLAWVAPAFMIAAAYGRRGSSAFWIGFVAGFAHFLSSLYWLLFIPYRWHGIPLAPGLGWLLLSAFLALYPALWLWLVSITPKSAASWRNRTVWAVFGAAAWVALEMIRARLFGGFPWNLMGSSQFQMTPLIQIASLAGIHGVSFLVVWTSLSLFHAVLSILRQPTARYAWAGEIVFPAMVVAGVFVFGIVQLRQHHIVSTTTRVGLVQPNIPQTVIWNQSENKQRFQRVIELSQAVLAEKPDVLIWPESAVPIFDRETYATIRRLAATNGVWMIFCTDEAVTRPEAKSEEDFDVFNSALLFNPEGKWVTSYRKQKLVIFGEYIPLVRWLPFLKYFTPATFGFTPGKEPVPFELRLSSPDNTDRSASVSALICYEDVFPHVARGHAKPDTDFLVNLTNDGWFGESAEQWQHMAGAVFRAVENGLPLVRCCNNGVTCWVDSRGRVREIFRDRNRSVYGEFTVITEIPMLNGGRRNPTLYNRYGDWFGWTCVGMSALWMLGRMRKPAD